jgi:hypothetical protein
MVREYVQQNHKVLISRNNVSFVTEINAVLKYTVQFLSIINITEALWGYRQVASAIIFWNPAIRSSVPECVFTFLE